MCHGIRLDVDFVLQKRSKPYMNAALCLEYIDHIFISYLADLQVTEKIKACKAVFFDGQLFMSRVRRCYRASQQSASQNHYLFSSRHSHLSNPRCDFVLGLEKHVTGLGTLYGKQPAAGFIIKVYHDFKQMIVEINIWDAFAAIGFTYDIGQRPYGLLFDKEKFRQSPSFRELWDRNATLEILSK
jgi:hypothetical protein